MLDVSIKKNLPDFTLDVSFTVNDNTLVLFGPSGCGKTTTLRCIAGLTRPDAGYIALDGQIFFAAETRTFVRPQARRVGYMFQDYALFPHLDVTGNILYGVKHRTQETDRMFYELLDLLRISHLARRDVKHLSGGEKQRVALARALMTRPRLLLLDEPLSALDITTRREIQEELKKLRARWRIPFILVTHDAEEAAALGDEIIYMDKGKKLPAA